MEDNFICEFCGREFGTKNACNSHRGKCKKNPNYEFKPKSYEWRKQHSERLKGRVWEPWVDCNCEFCGRSFNRKSAKTLHEKSCRENPNWVKGSTRTYSEETRKKISEGMKKAHREGRAGTFPSRKKCEHSYPEKWLIEVLKNELGLIENKDYETEYFFHKQFLDFAWPERKLCIEIDGQQHERFEERKLKDAIKDENLKAENWKLLRLRWVDIYNNKQEYIQKILSFLSK